MATNYVQDGKTLTLAVASGTVSGDPVVTGRIPGVALVDRDSSGNSQVQREGVFALSVKGVNDAGNVAIAVGDPIYYVSGDTPKLSAKISGAAFGVALEAVSSGATTTIKVLLRSRRPGIIPLDIFALREIGSNDIINTAGDAGALSSNTSPALARTNGATDKSIKVEWATGNSDEVQFPPIPKPPDMDDTADLRVVLLLSKDTNTDTAAVVAVSIWDGIGDSNAGGNTAALAVAALTRYAVTLAAADLSAYPGMLNVSLIPGTHANDKIRLHAAWIEYEVK